MSLKIGAGVRGNDTRALGLLVALLFSACFCGTSIAAGMGDLVGTLLDYADMNNWLAVPGERPHEVDLIYLYPTTYSPTSADAPLYCDIDDASMRNGAPDLLKRQASAFESCADIYAPFYRQRDAMALAGLTQPEMVEIESGVPRADVFAALDYYFEKWNDGRPFIIAGHSQGAMMTMIALSEYLAAYPERYAGMVAAYMLGNAPTKDWLAANPHLKTASSAGDTGVIVSWSTEGPANIGRYNMVVPEDSVCINPLNWRTDGTYADVSQNRGSLVQNAAGITLLLPVSPKPASKRSAAPRSAPLWTRHNTSCPHSSARRATTAGISASITMSVRENAEQRVKNFQATKNDGSSGCASGAGFLPSLRDRWSLLA